MLYRLLRGTAAIALRWYYADVVVQGRERVPGEGPLLIVANHPNALIDPLLVGTSVERRILLTAKATLFGNAVVAWLLQTVGVVPLRRAKDEGLEGAALPATPERNSAAFAQVTDALRRQRAVLIFPEGISHDDPTLAPLKSGAARMALQARGEGVAGIRLLPVGLVYEAKEQPDSRILVRIGEPLDLDAWMIAHATADPRELTEELGARLRTVTLNFATAERAARAVRLARVLSALAGEPLPVVEAPSLEPEAELAVRIDAAMSALAGARPSVIHTAELLVSELDSLERELHHRGIELADVRVSTRLPDAATFAAREGPLALLAGGALALGWITHWIPLRIARSAALRSLVRDASLDQPAMRTILLGVSAVVIWYVLSLLLIGRLTSPMIAVIALAAFFAAAHARRVAGGRLDRVVRRARSYLAFRADPTLQPRLVARVDALLAQALALEQVLVGAGGVVTGATTVRG